MDPKLLVPILLAALAVWAILRRVRRNFGRQPVQEARIWLRIAILTLVSVLVLVPSASRDTQMLEALTGGVVCGVALALVGLRHTQFEVTPEGRFYTPHTYIGLTVIALFVGRLLYRFLYLTEGTRAVAAADQNLASAYQRSPATIGIFSVLVGYYVLFYAGVLVKSRGLVPAIPPTATDENPPGAR